MLINPALESIGLAFWLRILRRSDHQPASVFPFVPLDLKGVNVVRLCGIHGHYSKISICVALLAQYALAALSEEY